MAERDEGSGAEKAGLWARIWRRPRSRWLLGVPFGAYLVFVIGAGFVIASEVMIHATGTNQFCTTACHSMEAFTAPEWRESTHYLNASGVIAGCSDCHIPHTYPEKLIVKAKAGIRDAWHEYVKGTISTREKYEAHRADMAQRVWDYMMATDSRECRYCHDEDNFDLSVQEDKATRGHIEAQEKGMTCIECHKGVAHRTPDEFEIVDGRVVERVEEERYLPEDLKDAPPAGREE